MKIVRLNFAQRELDGAATSTAKWQHKELEPSWPLHAAACSNSSMLSCRLEWWGC